MFFRGRLALLLGYCSTPATLSEAAGTIPTVHYPTPSRRPSRFGRRQVARWLLSVALGVLLLVTAGLLYEVRTSSLQSKAFSAYAGQASFTVAPGRSFENAFPRYGPFDERRGYTRLPQFIDRLVFAGYDVTEQARVSPVLLKLAQWGIHPPYDEPPVVGLDIRDSGGRILHDSAGRGRVFRTFEEIPPSVVQALLFIENRELGSAGSATANVAIEWDRLARATLVQVGQKIGLPLPTEGGSTLAVQLEKFRHSPSGVTRSPLDKLRQIAGASLRVYQSGPVTVSQHERIILEYLNSLPLAAQAGYGEIYGLGDGLYAWFGWDLDHARKELTSDSTQVRARALKHVLALLASVRAPSYYLSSDRTALDDRIAYYITAMEHEGIFDPLMAEWLRRAPIEFLNRAPVPGALPYPERKHIDAVRTYLVDTLELKDYYELDRLHLEVDTPIDGDLQDDVVHLLNQLKDPEFVRSNGLREDRLVGSGDPEAIEYSVTVFERTPEGNLLRVQADTLDRPFDLNQGMKMELGSTAKLRTVAHYLEVVAALHEELAGLGPEELAAMRRDFRDPISQWAAQTLLERGAVSLDNFLSFALARRYSTSTGETFFTGGGAHTFHNFDSKENGLFLTLREAFERSTNLVFIRLMRDLVRFHEARLPYDAEAAMNDLDHPDRLRLLERAADDEARQILGKAFRGFRGSSEDSVIMQVLGARAGSVRHLSMLFLAWNPEATAEDLEIWLASRLGSVTPAEAERMFKSYDPSRLNSRDYGYLLDRHPLEIWAAGMLRTAPDMSWEALLAASDEARGVVSTWLLETRNRRIQDLRLRTRIEQDAFERMTPYWKNLGFPFESLVPSLATAIGSSADRPIALAELMGVILNDGVRQPVVRVTGLRAASGTPYETALAPRTVPGESVMAPEVAQSLRGLLAEVVDRGTARRAAGAFLLPDGTRVRAGGKTGSGDNRYETYGRDGQVTSSRPVNRTATFVFYIGDRYFGAVTAHVEGDAARSYRFTSALPVTVLRMLAPSLNERFRGDSRLTERVLQPQPFLESQAGVLDAIGIP